MVYEKLFSIIILSLLSFTGLSCTDSTLNVINNVPTIGNVLNTFSYSLNASTFSSYQEYALNFNSDSVNIGISLYGYGGGNGSMFIKGKNDVTIYAKVFNSNMALGQMVKLSEIPIKIILDYNKFSGQLNFSFSAIRY